MSLPVILTSDMLGAPNLTPTDGSLNALLLACLVNGFNTQSVVSASASSGVVTFNFASDPGFSTLDTVTIAGASNATVNGQFRVQSAASNQVLVAIPGVPDGAVGGTITLKFSPLGWTRPYSGTGIGCYRQGGASVTKRFVRVYDNAVAANSYTSFMRGYESMTAVSTGTGPFPTTAQVTGNGSPVSSPSDATGDLPAQQYRAWAVVGTPRFFAIYTESSRAMYGSSDTKNSLAAANPLAMANFMFGELANVTKPADAFAHACLASTISNLHLPRAASGSGSAVLANINGSGAVTGSHMSLGAVYPSQADSGIHFTGPVTISESTSPHTLRGTLPGAMTPFESPFGNSSSPPAFGLELTGVAGVTGRVKMLYTALISYGDLGWLLDEDWGDV